MLDRVKPPETADRAEPRKRPRRRNGDAAPREGQLVPQRFAPQRLTSRIVLLNLLGLIILVSGILYFNQFRQGLIDARVQSLTHAGADHRRGRCGLGHGRHRLDRHRPRFARRQQRRARCPTPTSSRASIFPINPETAGPVLRRLLANTTVRARIIDKDGNLVVDSRFLYGARRHRAVRPAAARRAAPKASARCAVEPAASTWTFSYDYPQQIEYGLDNGKDFPGSRRRAERRHGQRRAPQ